MSYERQTCPASLRIALLATVLVGIVQPLAAEPARKPRKSHPVPAARTAPDITATIPQPKPPAAPADDDDSAPLKPFNLPAAPRARMHACGQKWQAVKMAGRAGDETWREFATKCLVDTDSAETKPQP